MFIGTYRRARRAIIIPRLKRRIYRDGEMISSGGTSNTGFVSSSSFIDAAQSVRDNARLFRTRANRQANIDPFRIRASSIKCGQSREIGKLSGTRQLSSGKSVTSRLTNSF